MSFYIIWLKLLLLWFATTFKRGWAVPIFFSFGLFFFPCVCWPKMNLVGWRFRVSRAEWLVLWWWARWPFSDPSVRLRGLVSAITDTLGGKRSQSCDARFTLTTTHSALPIIDTYIWKSIQFVFWGVFLGRVMFLMFSSSPQRLLIDRTTKRGHFYSKRDFRKLYIA